MTASTPRASRERRPRQLTSRQWPEAIEAAIESLDSVPAPVASGLLSPVQGLAQSLEPDSAGRERSNVLGAALDRLVGHLQSAAATGSPDASLGSQKLTQLLGEPEAMAVDLGRLEEIADAERARLESRSFRTATACGQAPSRAK